MSNTRTVLVLALFAGVAQPAFAQPDTGPEQQRMPWRPLGMGDTMFHGLNSVVEINAPLPNNFIRIGTGSIIDKRPDADPNFSWYCVLTADHVANPAGTTGPHTIRFGDNAAQGSNGAASNIIRRAPDAVANGGMGANVDIALIGIRAPKDAFFNQITPLGMVATTPLGAMGTHFTQPGYGGTGNFVAAAGALPAGMTTASPDSIKRFQNNYINRNDPANNYSVNGQNYAYHSIEWTFDAPAAPGAHGAAHNFLVGEGTSYGGDSGGPYLMSGDTTQFVGNFNRPGAGSNWDFPGFTGDEMPIKSSSIFAVHAYGETPAGGWPGGIVPYNRFAGGVPLTAGYINWIQGACAAIPTPGSFTLLALSGIAAFRRKR